MPVVVRAPATVANLGSGFDAIGVALAWYNEIRVEPSDELLVTAAGEGADDVPRDPSNLTVRAMRAVLGDGATFRLHANNAVPFGRGFGSSGAAIVAGLVAAEALGGRPARPPLEIATELEGHADNVAPCLLGGAVVCGGARALRLGVPPNLAVIACVAPSAFPTEAARGALPSSVSFADAVASVRRAATLPAALAAGDAESLFDATDDSLHQPARFALMPDSARLVSALRAEGIAAFLSGAGPSVAALIPADRADAAADAARRLAPEGWRIRPEDFDAAGASVVERRGDESP